MNKFLNAVGVALMVFSVNAFSVDQIFESDGKKVVITSSEINESMGHGADKYKTNEFGKNGIYIVVTNGTLGLLNDRMPNAEREVSELFKKNGFNIAESIESADAVIAFNAVGSLSIVDANNSAANSALPNKAQIASVGGQIINGVLTGGVIPGLVGAAAVLIYNPDSKVMLSGMVVKNAYVRKGWVGNGALVSKDEKYGSSFLKTTYKLEKNNEAPANIVLEMAVDQWIKKFVINDFADTRTAKTEPSKPAETPVVTKTTPVSTGSQEQ